MIYIILDAAGTALCVFWLFLFFYGRGRYKSITGTKACRKMSLNCLFPVGFSFMDIFRIRVTGSSFAARRRYASDVYGEENAEFYTYLNTAAEISYALSLLTVSLLAGAAGGKEELALLGGICAVLMLFVLDSDVRKKSEQKTEAIMADLPDMISRLTLLVSAGMVLREAWKRISESSDSVICLEMRRTAEDVHNGMPQTEAFERFADRCRSKEMRKFISSLNQNLSKGSSELVMSLQQMSLEQWEEKKNTVKRKGNAVEQKLLIPMIMIFAAIILMIVVPVFTNMF